MCSSDLGQANVSVLWQPGRVFDQTYDADTNTTRAHVTFSMVSDTSTGLVMRNTRRTPDSPVGSGFTDLRLIRPGYPEDGSVTFTEDFLRALGRAQVVRMMEWTFMQTAVQHWADRVTPAHVTQAGFPAPRYNSPDGEIGRAHV